MVDGADLADMPFIGTSSMYPRQGMCHRLDATESVILFAFFLIFIALPLHMYISACDSVIINIFSLCNVITSVLLRQIIYENMSSIL
jgi:hypothetical protein